MRFFGASAILDTDRNALPFRTRLGLESRRRVDPRPPPHLAPPLQSLDFCVAVGDSVWFGGHVTVCPGVTIGSNVTIGAGSVVIGDIPPNVLAAGNPCRVVREIRGGK